MTDDPDVEARRRYDAFHRRSLEDPDAFWREAAQLIDWSTPPDRVFEQPEPPSFRWFPGGHTNLAYNALDRHVAAGRGDRRRAGNGGNGGGKNRSTSWIVLAVVSIGFYARVVRASLLEVRSQDYVRTARAKGLRDRRVLIQHTLRNCLIPVVTLFGLDFGAAVGGTVILIEPIFGIEGVGQYAQESVAHLDLPPLMALTLYGAFFVVVVNTFVDLAYAWLDPRTRIQ